MIAQRKPALHIVERDRTQSPAEMLAAIVPELIEAETVVRRLRQHMSAEGRLLAAERGLRFIRDEQLRQEFRHG